MSIDVTGPTLHRVDQRALQGVAHSLSGIGRTSTLLGSFLPSPETILFHSMSLANRKSVGIDDPGRPGNAKGEGGSVCARFYYCKCSTAAMRNLVSYLINEWMVFRSTYG